MTVKVISTSAMTGRLITVVNNRHAFVETTIRYGYVDGTRYIPVAVLDVVPGSDDADTEAKVLAGARAALCGTDMDLGVVAALTATLYDDRFGGVAPAGRIVDDVERAAALEAYLANQFADDHRLDAVGAHFRVEIIHGVRESVPASLLPDPPFLTTCGTRDGRWRIVTAVTGDRVTPTNLDPHGRVTLTFLDKSAAVLHSDERVTTRAMPKVGRTVHQIMEAIAGEVLDGYDDGPAATVSRVVEHIDRYPVLCHLIPDRQVLASDLTAAYNDGHGELRAFLLDGVV